MKLSRGRRGMPKTKSVVQISSDTCHATSQRGHKQPIMRGSIFEQPDQNANAGADRERRKHRGKSLTNAKQGASVYCGLDADIALDQPPCGLGAGQTQPRKGGLFT